MRLVLQNGGQKIQKLSAKRYAVLLVSTPVSEGRPLALSLLNTPIFPQAGQQAPRHQNLKAHTLIRTNSPIVYSMKIKLSTNNSNPMPQLLNKFISTYLKSAAKWLLENL
jgi:hypothetical protein